MKSSIILPLVLLFGACSVSESRLQSGGDLVGGGQPNPPEEFHMATCENGLILSRDVQTYKVFAELGNDVYEDLEATSSDDRVIYANDLFTLTVLRGDLTAKGFASTVRIGQPTAPEETTRCEVTEHFDTKMSRQNRLARRMNNLTFEPGIRCESSGGADVYTNEWAMGGAPPIIQRHVKFLQSGELLAEKIYYADRPTEGSLVVETEDDKLLLKIEEGPMQKKEIYIQTHKASHESGHLFSGLMLCTLYEMWGIP